MLAIAIIGINTSFAQVSPTVTRTASSHVVTIPVRDMPVITNKQVLTEEEHQIRELNEGLKDRYYPYAATALPQGSDPVWQKTASQNTKAVATIIDNFDGQTSGSFPPDCSGSVGPGYFFEAYNTSFAIYDLSGSLITGPTAYNTLFNGVLGADRNDGDPIILWDEQAGRWFAAEFSLGSNNYMLIAVSQTSDPTGAWDAWSFDVDDMPDYMKFGIWEDGYYMADNNSGGTDIYVFERSEMLTGGASPQMIGFSNPNRPASGFHCIMPLDCDGNTFAPSGTPGQFMTINDDAWGGSDELWIYELDADWNNTSNSTFSRTQQLAVPAFDSDFGSNWDNIAQPGTSQELDGIPQILMYRVQYRNFGSSQNMVAVHTVDVDGTDHAGLRWYELENTGSSWSIRQSGTYAPDDASRWIGSIAMNANHEIGLAYSISDASNNIYPGIRFTGQTASENSAASGIMDVTETSAIEGGTYQSSYNRWGDYAQLSLDPNNDNDFWYNSEYMQTSNSTKGTRIVGFRFTETGDPIGLTATAVASDQIDLSWSLNSNNDNALVAWSSDGTFGTPVDGTVYSAGQTISGGGIVLNYGAATSYNHTGLTSNTTYYYKAWSYLSNDTYSPGVIANATTPSGPVTTYPFTWDFESCTDYTQDFTPWTTYDGNNVDTYSSSDADFTGEGTAFAWLAMNPVASGWTGSSQGDDAHGGSLCGLSSCPSDGSTADHWFISPPLQLNSSSSFSLWALTPKDDYGLSNFEIMVSTTDNNISSFSAISSTEDAPATWTQFTYDLSAYDNQTIYIAIRDISPDIFLLWIDDLEITSTGCVAPSITSQPNSTTACSGDNASFSVTANDADSYQWQLNGTNISGANSATYNISGVTTSDGGSYTCIVTNTCDNVTSTAATLTVNPATAINTQPTGGTYCEGDNVSLSVTASGGGLSYQWQLNGSNVSGATSATYNMLASNSNGGDYTCYVTGDCGNTTSNAATVVVNASTAINTQPTGGSYCVGDNLTLSVSASGTSVSYQWQLNGTNISGANSNTYSISGLGTSDAGDYSCNVTGICGNESSNSATVTVNTTASITSQPDDQIITLGSTATFSVTATGSVTGYQWYLDGSPLSNGGNISGATSATLTITNASTSDMGNYTCQVTGDCGSVTSNSALLDITSSINADLPEGVSIYPNPTYGHLQIDAAGISRYKVMDLTGRVIIEKEVNSNSVNIDLTGFDEGTYMIQFNYSDGEYIGKINKIN